MDWALLFIPSIHTAIPLAHPFAPVFLQFRPHPAIEQFGSQPTSTGFLYVSYFNNSKPVTTTSIVYFLVPSLAM